MLPVLNLCFHPFSTAGLFVDLLEESDNFVDSVVRKRIDLVSSFLIMNVRKIKGISSNISPSFIGSRIDIYLILLFNMDPLSHEPFAV